MSHLAVRTLIEDTVRAVDDSVLFCYARASDFNSKRKPNDKCVVLDPLNASSEYTNGSFNLTKTWKVEMVFYQLDKLQGAEEETAAILDKMDDLLSKFVAKLNFVAVEEDNQIKIGTQIELTGFTQGPAVKVTSDAFTGYTLTFNIIVPDDFNYCSIFC